MLTHKGTKATKSKTMGVPISEKWAVVMVIMWGSAITLWWVAHTARLHPLSITVPAFYSKLSK